MRTLSSPAALFVALAVIFPAPAVAGSDLARRVYDRVMEAYEDYADLPEPKVMAACIKWDPAATPPVFVHRVFATYTGITSDRPIFLTDLANNAKYRCKRWRKKQKVDCTCQMLDMNGKNVLKPPK